MTFFEPKIRPTTTPSQRSLNKNSHWTPSRCWVWLPRNLRGKGRCRLTKNLEKVQKTSFLTLKMVIMTSPESQILTKNFNFRGHLSTFRAKNTPKSGHFKSKKKMPKYFLNNSRGTLKKSQKPLCLQKWSKITPSNDLNRQKFDQKYQF